MKVYKYDTTPVLIGTINVIINNTTMTINQDSGYSGYLSGLFYVDLASISLNAEGERFKGQYALATLTVDTADQTTAQQLYSATAQVVKSELSNK